VVKRAPQFSQTRRRRTAAGQLRGYLICRAAVILQSNIALHESRLTRSPFVK
jgi:hypothetical protein